MVEPNWRLAGKRAKLMERARIIQMIRAFFIEHDYLETETPHRVPGNAPEGYIAPVASETWFLHTSPELAMKRLLAAGYPRLFQICRCWRHAERGSRHLPEFTMLEWYRAQADYRDLMAECEMLLNRLVPGGELVRAGRAIDLRPPWERLSVAEAFARHTATTPQQALAADRFDEIIAFEIEPHLGSGRPTFLIDYPAPLAALARKKPDNPEIAERFELYIAGLELANAFSELTEPVEQRARFAQEETIRRSAGQPPYPMPEKFLAELAHMPPAAGIALGIDRLVMLLTGAAAIDEVVAFTPEDL
ncbi:lysyl-tRNA synthetase, class 2 [Geoalkalibacter ferrihydriticus]|uniref:Lysyl-tRNA synthetase n=2 Tax=Geoalkalibacter ferrihydriticus TaxID=392333 RepID=A0A0C2DRX3_9BACT|nr:EF-P lysine aminoacylase EpmA [Geoalkalibacter ferrihydriticus]KIH76194.1 lysyl-tRNA synthetase [Geoalkalibacter ferrihydriticus DSM 17813]SDL27932.1 lysyl-tRNA synthetase, class 2 [Geoalkalibacter ferrihydriticus]